MFNIFIAESNLKEIVEEEGNKAESSLAHIYNLFGDVR